MERNFGIWVKFESSILATVSPGDYFGIIKFLSVHGAPLHSARHRVFFFLLLFFLLPSVTRNRCGHISGARNHQFRARKRQVKRVWLRAYLNKHFALRSWRRAVRLSVMGFARFFFVLHIRIKLYRSFSSWCSSFFLMLVPYMRS